jgi:AraC-like DNA-binding protein
VPSTKDVASPYFGAFFLAELRRRRIDTKRILEAFELDASAPSLPLARHEEFAAACAEAARDPLFALAVARGIPRGGYGLVEFVWRAAATTRAALDEVVRFAPLLSPVITVRPEYGVGKTRLVIDRPPVLEGRHVHEYSLGYTLKGLVESTGGKSRVLGVGLAHPRHEHADKLEEALAARVSFSQTSCWIDVDDASLDLPHVDADAALVEAIRRTLEPALARASRTLTFVERVRLAVEASLAESDDVRIVATQLRMSTRTLQRRLAEEGTSFRAVVDRARRVRAERLVADPKISFTELAFQLGFADASAFTRAFRRWTGMAPQQARSNSR